MIKADPSFHIKFGLKFKDLRVSEKTSFNFETWETFGQGQNITLTFDTYLASYTHLVDCFNHLWGLRAAIVSNRI